MRWLAYLCEETFFKMAEGEGREEEAFIPIEGAQGLSDEEDALLNPPGIKQRKKELICFLFLGSILCILLSVVVITTVTTATVLAFHGAGSASSSNVQQTFTLDQVFNSSLTPSYYHGQWVNQIDALARLSSGAVVLYFPHNDTTVTLVPNNEAFKISDFKISPSLKYVVLMGRSEKQYRHSKLAEYFIFNTSSQTTTQIVSPKGNHYLQYVEWSPVSDHLAFTADYTLYVMDVADAGQPVSVADGRKDVEQVGVPDWVYEEEMLESDHAVWWSPDGQRLLYVEFSDISVPIFSFPIYGPEAEQYPDIENIAYPKSGMPNPNVTVYANSLASMTALTLMPPTELDKEHYIQIGGWVNATHVYLLWLNRPQNQRIFTLYDLSSSQSAILQPVRKIVESSAAWIEVSNNPPPIAVKGTSDLLVILSSGWKGTAGGFLHLARIDLENSAVNFLTSGDWEVTDVVGYSTDGSDVLYISTQTHTWERHVYSSKSKKCLTCDDSRWNLSRGSLPDLPTTCSVYHAVCSNSLTYCILHCYGPTLPYSLLVKYENGQFVQVKVLAANEHVVTAAQNLTVSKVQYFTVPADKGGPELYGRMILPPNFDSQQKYPVLVHVYGGPGSQMVLIGGNHSIKNYDVFSQRWELFQTAALNCIIVSVDGRGTGFRGDKYKFDVYRQLGNLETVDQIRAGKYLQSLSYVDGKRLAIYGTSYGGYMAAMVGSSGSGVFNVAISRSPVVDWRYYDSIYTERYMGTPDGNEAGYDNSSVLHRVNNLSSVNFLLIHGTGDDNVHFQNSAQLVRTLTDADIQFQVQFYTDKAHSISGVHARKHLYTLINDFLQSNLKL